MCEKIKIWTRQNENILDVLHKEGRYIVKKEYIVNKLDTISNFFLDVYSWYTNKAKDIVLKPNDCIYPIWVSLNSDFGLQHVEGTVILELLIDKELVITMDVEKWGLIVNYWYVPLNMEDRKKHEEELEKYGISDDSKVYMSNFYPHLKKQLIESWDRLFDNSYCLSNIKQGTIWEVKKEWIVDIKR